MLTLQFLPSWLTAFSFPLPKDSVSFLAAPAYSRQAQVQNKLSFELQVQNKLQFYLFSCPKLRKPHAKSSHKLLTSLGTMASSQR